MGLGTEAVPVTTVLDSPLQDPGSRTGSKRLPALLEPVHPADELGPTSPGRPEAFTQGR